MKEKSNNAEMLETAHALNMSINEYLTATNIIANVRTLVSEKIQSSICHHCLMQQTCEKYGKPVTCLKTAQYNDLEELLSHINLKEMTR